MTDANHALAMKYAFITNRVLRVLLAGRKGTALPDHASESCERAAKLLLEMRRGAAVFDRGSQGQLGYSAESIPAITRALGIIDQLSLASHMTEVRQVLEAFARDLETLSQGRALDEASVGTLYRFFAALNDSLTEEVSRGSLGAALENYDHVGT